jgi:CRISPR-associated protein Cas6
LGCDAKAGRSKIGWPSNKSTFTVDETAVTDVQFELRGARIPIDHGYALYRELARLLPWLEEEALAGIHPIHGADSGGGDLILNRRTKLVVRISAARANDLRAIEGKSIEVGGNALLIGAGKAKALPHHTPLYAHCVTTGSADEGDFSRDIMRLLDELGIETRFLCGLRQTITTDAGRVAGYSLMLHGLPIEHAIRVQQVGIGSNRKLGCGIFIPHKSITAV